MRVLSTGTCETLSGSSKLTYHIGLVPDGENDAGAQQHRRRLLTQEWISLGTS